MRAVFHATVIGAGEFILASHRRLKLCDDLSVYQIHIWDVREYTECQQRRSIISHTNVPVYVTCQARWSEGRYSYVISWHRNRATRKYSSYFTNHPPTIYNTEDLRDAVFNSNPSRSGIDRLGRPLPPPDPINRRAEPLDAALDYPRNPPI